MATMKAVNSPLTVHGDVSYYGNSCLAPWHCVMPWPLNRVLPSEGEAVAAGPVQPCWLKQTGEGDKQTRGAPAASCCPNSLLFIQLLQLVLRCSSLPQSRGGEDHQGNGDPLISSAVASIHDDNAAGRSGRAILFWSNKRPSLSSLPAQEDQKEVALTPPPYFYIRYILLVPAICSPPLFLHLVAALS